MNNFSFHLHHFLHHNNMLQITKRKRQQKSQAKPESMESSNPIQHWCKVVSNSRQCKPRYCNSSRIHREPFPASCCLLHCPQNPEMRIGLVVLMCKWNSHRHVELQILPLQHSRHCYHFRKKHTIQRKSAFQMFRKKLQCLLPNSKFHMETQ
jgi:hypothetical protein